MADHLTGQLIGSIRRVRFGAANEAVTTTGVLELETKAGRYAHLVADRDTRTIRLNAGAAQPPTDRRGARHWEDLTLEATAAFDGRPMITAITPLDPIAADPIGEAARAWRFELSNGTILVVEWSAEGPVLSSAGRSAGGAP